MRPTRYRSSRQTLTGRWHQRTARRRPGAPGPPARATERSTARIRAARPRCHRQRPATRPAQTVPDRPVREPPRRARPGCPSRSVPDPPTPAPHEDRPPRRPARPTPTWQTAASPGLSRLTRSPEAPTWSARQRPAPPPGSHPADPASPRSTICIPPVQRPPPRAIRSRRQASKSNPLRNSVPPHVGRSLQKRYTRPPTSADSRRPPAPVSASHGLAPTHHRKIGRQVRPTTSTMVGPIQAALLRSARGAQPRSR